MEKQHSIAFMLQDFSDFVTALTNKMVEAVQSTNLIVDLRTINETYQMPVTLRDYLEIWENITEMLKETDGVFIDFYENDCAEKPYSAYYLDITLWIEWDGEHYTFR